LVSLVIIKIIL